MSLEKKLLVPLWAAIAVAQLGFSVRTGVATFAGPLVLGWAAASLRAWDRRAGLTLSRSPLEAVAGTCLALAPLVALASLGAYHPALRLAGVVSGLGLIVLAAGVRQVSLFWRELLLLALPLLTPFPAALRAQIAPMRATASVAALLMRLSGLPVVWQGAQIDIPGASVEVIEACSGVLAISQVLALAVVVVCLFRASRVQQALVFSVAILTGFLLNAVRVVIFTIVVRDAPQQVWLWHDGWYGPIFASASTLVACLLWWAVLRGEAPETGATSSSIPAVLQPAR